MTKKELVARVFEENPQIMKKDIERVVNSVFNAISDSMVSGGSVSIRDFGVFFLKNRSARRGRDAVTGEMICIPARKLPSFKPSRKLIEVAQEHGIS